MEFFICEYCYFNNLTGTCWENTSTSDILITLCWINIKFQDNFKRFVKLPRLAYFLASLENFVYSEVFVLSLQQITHRMFSTTILAGYLKSFFAVESA